MNTDITKMSASAAWDILSLFGIPTSSIQELWNAHCERKLAESRDILFDEIKQGNFNNIADDDKISLMHRYTLAAMNGAARLNLRLLAKAINSIAMVSNYLLQYMRMNLTDMLRFWKHYQMKKFNCWHNCIK